MPTAAPADDSRGGELIQAAAGGGTIHVQVECPGETSVALKHQRLVETIPLVNGKGELVLSCIVPGTFIVTPADRQAYCAAGKRSVLWRCLNEGFEG